jgi:hypothetical protein
MLQIPVTHSRSSDYERAIRDSLGHGLVFFRASQQV